MVKIIAITNQKGGVGKTTTAINLGAKLKKLDKRVLFIDMDPQCSLTYAIGAEVGYPGVMELLTGQASADRLIMQTDEGDLLCANPNLSSLDQTLTQPGREYRLKQGLMSIRDRYDYIIIDSPPTLGILTVNILTAADFVLIPALADIFSLQGVGQLYATIQAVQTYCNPALRILGIVLTRHSERLILSREMREMLEETAQQLGTKVFQSRIREAVSLRESQAARQSIFNYAPRSKQAQDYEAFVQEALQEMNALGGTQNHG